MNILRFIFAAALAALLAPLSHAELIWVVGPGNSLVSFDHLTPGTPLSTVAISGLSNLESVVGIDSRPASGDLYALTDASRLYNINTSTGAATLAGAGSFSPLLSGNLFGVDFNPTVDRVRVVSQTDQNLRLHPDLGTVVATDSTLAYAPGDIAFGVNPSVVGVAYTNSVPTASTTTLYAIDSARNTLVRQGSVNAFPTSPNTGQLFTIGSLGVSTGDSVGFDVSSATGVAFAALQVNGGSTLYTIDLSTGVATAIGNISGVSTARGLAVGQDPIVYTVPIVGAATGLNGSSFRSDLILTNSSAFSATARIDFYQSSSVAGSGITSTLNVMLAPGEQKIYRDIVRSQFNSDPGTGSLRVSASRPIAVLANIYNDQRPVGRGTFGQIIRASEASERQTSGFLPGLSNIPASTAAGLRTNVGFFNPGAVDSEITMIAKSSLGATLATATRIIPALSHQQVGLSEIFPLLLATDEVYVSYTATSPIFVYASVVDNTSGDGMYIRAESSR
ncbi:MAG: DUF4394 domain-containing protein [Thermoanaerobaculia bacterium]